MLVWRACNRETIIAENDSFEINDDRFQKYLLPNSRVETLFTGMEWGEGPV